MSHDKIGAKEAQQRDLAKNKRERLNQIGRKPSTADLRNKIARIKPMVKHGGRRGR